MTGFLEFFLDVVTHVSVFNTDIETIHLDYEGEKIVVVGNHPKMRLFYRIQANPEVAFEMRAPGVFGTIGYLKAVLGSSLMKQGSVVEFEYSDDHKYIRRVKFTSNRYDVMFQCTNPSILTDKNRIRQIPRPVDAIHFPMTRELRKEFEDVSRVAVPKADTRSFNVEFDGSCVRAKFGGLGHTSSLIMATDITGNTEQKLTKRADLDRFRTLIKLGTDKGNENARLTIHNMVIWMDFNSPTALHTVILPHLKDTVA